MKPKSKKHLYSPPPATDEQRTSTSALSYLRHRLFHSSRSATSLVDHEPDRSVHDPSTTPPPPPKAAEPTAKSSPQPQALDIPSPMASASNSLALDRPFSKSLENNLQLGRPVFRRTTSDLHSPQITKKGAHAANRSSQIIWKEGYLYKKTDFRPFHSHKADRGWKLYRVVLRGHKLYLYRTTTPPHHQDNHKSLLALNSSSASSVSSSTSSIQLLSPTPPPKSHSRSPSFSSTTSMAAAVATTKEKHAAALDPSHFDDDAKRQLFTTPPLDLVYAAVFTEWDRQRKKTATAVYLLIYSDRLVVCKKRKQDSSGILDHLWHIQSSTPLQQLVLSVCKPAASTLSLSSPPSSSSSSSTPTYSENPSPYSVSSKHDGGSSYFLGRSTSSVSSPTANATPPTLVNRFTLSFVSQPWNQTTYVSLSKELVSSWMLAFYDAQHACENGKVPMETPPSTGQTERRVSNEEAISVSEQDGAMISTSSVDTTTTIGTASFDECIPHPALILDGQEDRSVLGGTVPALVHELLYETQKQGKEFTYAFLLTYNMFTTISEVLDLMKGYLDRSQGTPLAVSLWTRLLDLYRIWCVRFAYDVVGDLVTGMMERLDALQEDTTLSLDIRSRGKEIKALILQTVQDNQHIIEHAQTQRDYGEGVEVVDVIQQYSGGGNDSDSKSMDAPTTPTSPVSLSAPIVDLSDLVATGLSPALFLSMDPERLAEQIYIFHHTQHYLHRYQLLSALSYVSRPQVPPQMLNTLLFTSPSPHFLTRLIWQHILVETRLQQTDNAMVMRTSLLEHWVRVGAALMELKDMTGWSAVAMGICSMEIARLKEAWKTVHRPLVKMVAHVWGPLLADHGIYSLDVWMEGWEHESRLQDLFSQILDVDSLDLPAHVYSKGQSSLRSLPHFGSLKQSVDRLRRHVPLYLSSANKDVVNFMSSWCIHDTIRSGLGTWKKGRLLGWDENDTKGLLPFQVVRPLQMYFESSINQVSSVPHDFKYLHECSLVCEPRIFGQAMVDRPSKEVAGPSYSPLAFPDTLDSSYTFFPKSASLKLFGQTMQKQDSQQQQQQSLGHEVQLVHRQEQPSYLAQASLSALQKMDTMACLNTKRDSVATLPDDEVSRWMEDTSFLAQHNQVVALNRQLDYTRRHHRENENLSGNNHGWLFHLRDNTLVLTAEGLLALPPPSSPGTSIAFDKELGATSIINVRAGYLVPLVDVLVHGVGQFKTTMQQQWRALGPSSTSRNDIVDLLHPAMDDEEYMRAFFTTYRMFCSPKRLMMTLQDQFTQAKAQGSQAKRQQQEQSKKQRRRMTMMDAGFASAGLAKLESMEQAPAVDNGNDVLAFDWLVVAKTQLRVVHILMYWIEKHFYDVVDQIDLLGGMLDLMMTAKTSLALWQLPLAQHYEQHYGGDGEDDDGLLKQRTTTDSGIERNVKAALELGDKIGAGLDQLQTLLARKSLSPSYDLKAIQYDTQGSRSADELYRQLTNGKQQFSVMLQLATSKTSTFSLIRTPLDDTAASVVDRYSASTLLEQADRAVRQLFGSVTLQDWIQTTDMLEAQSNDLYAWLPARNSSSKDSLSPTSGTNGNNAASLSPSSSSSSLKQQQQQHQQKRPSLMASALSPVVDAPTAHYSDYHHLHSDEIIISDIFIGIEGARRSMVSPLAVSADDLLLAFPSSIQYLYCMHYIIRSWAIHEVTAPKIDLSTRVARIDTFLQMIGLSRSSCQKLGLFAELKNAASTPGGNNTPTYVPGFVENAVASALVSPEVRLFTKAWKLIGQKYKVSDLDTLAPFFRNMARATATSSVSPSSPLLDHHLKDDVLLTPSIGWIFERIVELSLVIPDTYQGMIHFDKRRYVYRFLRMVMNAQLKLETQSTSQAIGMSFLISPNNKKRTWKMLKDEAYKEKSQNHHHHHHHRPAASAASKLKSSHSSGSIGSSAASSTPHLSTKHGVFSKLVSAQMDKLKRDIKERERIDREWKDVQHKLQKRQADQLRNKQHRKPGQQHRRHASSSSVIVSTSPPSADQLTVTPSTSLGGAMPHGIKWPALLRTFRPPSMASFHILDDLHQTDASGMKKATANDTAETMKAAMVINLIHATTSIASGYEKRPFVFRVVTEEGAQYLLQGASVEDMQNWMDEINQAARHGTAKRRSVFAAESKEGTTIVTSSPVSEAATSTSERTRKQKKTTTTAAATTRTTVYGVSLEVLKERELKDVPPLVTKCINEIERRGLEEVGIYRVAGTGSVVQQLRKEFNSGASNVIIDDYHYPDINVVADALKQFLRELPEPLLTFVLYDEFINASASEDHDDRVYRIKQAILKLPIPNYQLLKRLVEHFVVVTDYEAINHMYATNLAIVFGPTLLQPTPGPAAFTTSMSNLGHHQNVVKYLILHYHYLFDIDGGE
ncbi:hypothetical protein [Absidia glauca]|uniref:Ras-GEF domain-containing protein n=1 Tax=Absidia glauca TaxID=4829 RepID=A0A163JUD3_ABSGL|nr:hypothetical protein [Absidia glauca]